MHDGTPALRPEPPIRKGQRRRDVMVRLCTIVVAAPPRSPGNPISFRAASILDSISRSENVRRSWAYTHAT